MLFAGGPLGSGKQWYCTQAVFHKSSPCDNYLLPKNNFNIHFDMQEIA